MVACAAPAHQRLPAALELADKAKAGEIHLYLPSVCLAETRKTIRRKFQPRAPADSLRKYLAWATRQQAAAPEDCEIVRRVLDRFESHVLAELEGLDRVLESLRKHPGIEVFPLSEEMLERAVALSVQNLDLEPFDQAILAAVLVRAERLSADGADNISFCELDGDLQPWDKNGRAKEPLVALYDAARVWVYGDFAMDNPRRPPNWPDR